MVIIIIGRNQRSARNSFLNTRLTFLEKRKREEHNVSLKISKMAGSLEMNSLWHFSLECYPYHFILYNSAVLLR